jgi:isopenicillin N synthase-like dioxygenase
VSSPETIEKQILTVAVEAKDGSWIPADPLPGALVVNIGDIMDSLTSHAYKSTYHRVIHRGSKFRVSIPFFFEPPRDMVITPIKSMIPDGQEGSVKPFTYFDHLKVGTFAVSGSQ